MGNHVDFKETIIIMTSNIGARFLSKGGKMGFEEDYSKAESKKEQILDEMRRFFNPEFINRVDEIIIFDPLTRENIRSIVDNLVEEINLHIINRNIHVVLSKAAKDYFAEEGYSEIYGARPLRRLMRKEIEDELANMLLEQKITHSALVNISIKNKKLHLHVAELPEEQLEELRRRYLVEQNAIDNYWNDNYDIAVTTPQKTDSDDSDSFDLNSPHSVSAT
jgi:ATP-dependent Clp protease ATP-binding subunit ClpA